MVQVGGLPQTELNQLELQFLLLNDFRLVIPLDEMQRYGDQLLLYSQTARATAGGEEEGRAGTVLMDGEKMRSRRRSGTSQGSGGGGGGSESGSAKVGVPMGTGRGGAVRIPSEDEVRKSARSREGSVSGELATTAGVGAVKDSDPAEERENKEQDKSEGEPKEAMEMRRDGKRRMSSREFIPCLVPLMSLLLSLLFFSGSCPKCCP